MKHISKYESFTKTGYIPKKTEIERFLKSYDTHHIELPHHGPVV